MNAEATADPVGIDAKLLAAQMSVEGVVKKGWNEDKSYHYATASDVVEVARGALHEVGLFSAIADVHGIEREAISARSGSGGFYVELLVTLRITDAASGEVREFVGAGAGADYGGGDKAILKATTAATKYAYGSALALPFLDADPERDAPGTAARVPAQTPDPERGIDDDSIRKIATAYKASGIDFPRLCAVIGGVGGEAPKINRRDSIRKAVAELSPEQGEQILSTLDALAAEAAKAAESAEASS